MNYKQIPLDVFRIIQQYLSKHDYRQFLNSNLAIFQHIKNETVYYNLLTSISRIEEQRSVRDFLSRLYRSVKDKKKQISLSSNDIIEDCTSFMEGIHKLNYRGYSSRKLTDISLFCNIHYLHLQGLSDIDRISGLSGIKILHIFSSDSIRKIDFIPGLKKLIIDSLPNLLEISDYGNIPTLEIRYCPHLTLHGLGNHESFCMIGLNHMILEMDLSIFCNVQYLTISADTSGYSCLKGLNKVLPSFSNLTHLSIGYSNRSFHILSFQSLQHLKLTEAKISSKVLFPSSLLIAEFKRCIFDDLIVLFKIKVLTFYQCDGREFNDINSLSNAHKLGFYHISELENVSSLDKVNELRIVFCKKVKDISKLGRVHRLYVENCGINSLSGLGEGNCKVSLYSLRKIIDFSPLRFIYKISLINCDGLVDGRGLSDVTILTICSCRHFTDTSNLGKVQTLRLIMCSKIERLVGLENVPHIHLEKCHKLEDIDCLGKQKSLIIRYCSRLRQLIKQDLSGKYERLFERINFFRIDPQSPNEMIPLLLTANKGLHEYFERDILFETEH